jgi:hypothetical protein
MNDQDLERTLRVALARRLDRTFARPDIDKVFVRLQRREARRRRLVGGVAVVAVVAAGVAGYAIGASDLSPPAQVVAAGDGAPSDLSDGTSAPADAASATYAVVQAFQDGLAGGSLNERRNAAVQGGHDLEKLRAEALALAEARGFSREQLESTTIDVLDVRFVDRRHAVVHFTLSLPPIGPVIVDQVGYAVFDDGRWRVALRTVCDILSLGGVGRACPTPVS